MALTPQTVDVPFEGGLDTNLDRRKVIPGKLLELENASFNGSSIEARPGSSLLSDNVVGGGGTMTEARALASVGEELLRWASDGIYGQVGSNAWVKRAGPAEANPLAFTVENIAQQPRNVDTIDAASAGGVTVYTWTEAQEPVGGLSARRVLRVSVVDNTSRARYLTAEAIDTDIAGLEGWRILCRPISCAGVIVIVYGKQTSGSNATIYARTILPSNPSNIGGPVILVSPPLRLGATYPYELDALDMTTSPTAGRFAIAYNGAAGGISISHWAVSALGGVSAAASPGTINQSPMTGANVSNVLGANIKRTADGSRIFLTFFNANNSLPELHTYRTSDMVRLNAVNLQLSAYGPFRMTALEASPGAMVGFFEVLGNTQPLKVGRWSTDGERLSVLIGFVYGVRLAGDAFTLGGRGLLPVLYHDTSESGFDRPGIQPTAFLLDAETAQVVARMLDGEAGGPYANSNMHIPHTLSGIAGAGTAALIVPRRGRAEFGEENGVIFDLTPVSLAQVNMTAVDPASVARIEEGGTLHYGGACPSYYDGTSWVEDGFHVRPEGVKVTLAAGVPGGLSAGTYQWSVCYEWDDAKGRKHRSAPSIPVALTVAANTSVRLEVPVLDLTRKSNVRMCVYRTLANTTEFHRQTYSRDAYLQPEPRTSPGRTVTLTDGATDVSVRDNELLSYGGPAGGTSGGELLHTPPPAYRDAHRHAEYIVTDDMNDSGTVRYSLPLAFQEGPAWARELFLAIPSTNGAVRAFSTLDDKLVVHTAGGAYVVAGQGPTRDGLNNGFTSPVFVTGSVGCVSPSSVVSTSDGIMFQAPGGIYLLSRALETRKTGAGVDAYAGLTVTRALEVVARREVRFYTAEGRTLVYSDEWRQWSTWTGQPTRDAVVRGTLVHYADGTHVRLEDPTLATEAGAPFALVVGSAWLKWSGFVGLERVWKSILLGHAQGTVRLKVEVFFDYQEATPGQVAEKVFPGSSVGGPPVFRVRQTLGKQLCTALRFRWTLTPEPSAPGDSGKLGLTSLTLEFGVHPKASKRKLAHL